MFNPSGSNQYSILQQDTITTHSHIINNTNNISNIYVALIRKRTPNGTIDCFTVLLNRVRLLRNETLSQQTVVKVSIQVVVQSTRTGLSLIFSYFLQRLCDSE